MVISTRRRRCCCSSSTMPSLLSKSILCASFLLFNNFSLVLFAAHGIRFFPTGILHHCVCWIDLSTRQTSILLLVFFFFFLLFLFFFIGESNRIHWSSHASCLNQPVLWLFSWKKNNISPPPFRVRGQVDKTERLCGTFLLVFFYWIRNFVGRLTIVPVVEDPVNSSR